MSIFHLPAQERTIALISGLWIYLILVMLGPFDVHDVRMTNRFTMMLGYGIIFSCCYLIAFWSTSFLAKIVEHKRVMTECLMIAMIFLLTFLPTFLYYKSDFIAGEYAIVPFFTNMYVPLSFLFLSVLALLRKKWLSEKGEIETRVINGQGKYESLTLALSDLIYVKSANNYIEVHYLQDGIMCRKLLRQKLKKVREDVPELVQTHRSYMINPDHLLGRSDKNTLQLTAAEIPLSERFQNDIALL